MRPRQQLGVFAKGLRQNELSATPISDITSSSIAIVSQRGKSRPLVRPFEIDDFKDCPLIVNNAILIWKKILKGVSPSTIEGRVKLLRVVEGYCAYYVERTGIKISETAQIDFVFTHLAIEFLETEKQRVRKFQFFIKLWKEIGVDRKLMPDIPWDADSTEPRDLLTSDQVKRATGLAKNAIRVILRRRVETERLDRIGFDPRRKFGGEQGSWDLAQCRYYIMKNVFKFELHKFDVLRFSMNLNNEIRGLENRDGAEYVDLDGQVVRDNGWLGHLRWVYPFGADLAPFIILILLRTNFNLSALGTMKTGRGWELPCPIQIGSSSTEDFSYIICDKVRGRVSKYSRPKPVRAMSSKSNWSHAFQLLRSVDELTRPLRDEVKRQISVLQTCRTRSVQENQVLAHLLEIKDDLFIFKTEQQITSLAKSGNSLRWISMELDRYGLPSDTRYLRDAGLSYSFLDSGQNLLILRLLANHSNTSVSQAYAMRRQTIERQNEMFKATASASLALVRGRGFTIEGLKAELTAQGYNQVQTANLLDSENITRFGNGCADPRNPPKEFRNGTSTNGICAGQDCIDGCPFARWFKESLPHVVRQLIRLTTEQSVLGVENEAMSSLQPRIDRLQTLLGNWPVEDVKHAYIEAEEES